ncbi:MAG TPA: TonB-dependent receptor [Novosphingobium sp.]|nr:TonB-dependent receptor [Novosphingobium sp.]
MLQKYALAAGTALAVLIPTAAFAQAEAPQSGGLGEIVVTAEKKPSTEQRTPIAMTVATGKELATSGVVNIAQLQTIAPTVNFAQNNANTMITIRGVSSRNYTETGDPAVAVSLDNFYLQRAFVLNASLFDVDRVEVLRGPQGTLYGRNATAGAINIATVKPSTDKWAGNASAEVGNYGTINLEAGINAPITDNLAIRVSGEHKSHDGYRDNGAAGRGDDADTNGGRIHLLWKPTTRLSVLLTGEYVKSDGIGGVIKGVPLTSINGDGSLNIGSAKGWSLNNRGYTNIEAKSTRWAFNYDLGFATLSYFGGFQWSTLHRDNDQDGGTQANYGFQQNENVEDQNHEIRIVSSSPGPLHWQAGLYYFNETDALNTYFQIHSTTAAPINYYTFNYNVGSRSKAAFAQVGYDVLPNVKVEGGIRYSKDEKYQVGTNNIAGTAGVYDNHYSGDKVTWHGGINWQATRRNLFYAKVDRGYKSGGFATTNSYAPETITAYEIGTKNRFFNNTLQVNLDGFFYDYKSMQVNVTDSNTALTYVLNAGAAKVKGVELETMWSATPHDRLEFSAAYLDAHYSKFCTVTTTPCPAADNLAGKQMIQAPRWTLSAAAQHEFRVGNASLTARIQTHYQTSTYFTIYADAAESQKAYTKTDATLTYAPDGGHYTVGLYVRNLENSVILTANEAAGYANAYLVQFADPRTFGGRVTYNF